MLKSIDTICHSKYMELEWVGPLVLCEEEVSRVPIGIPGVYMLHNFYAARGRYGAVYVGKARDLRDRLAEHMESTSTSPDLWLLRRRIQMYFSAAPVMDAAGRDAVEAGLIRLLRPPFNRQVPRVRSIYTNLPPMVLIF